MGLGLDLVEMLFNKENLKKIMNQLSFESDLSRGPN